MSTSRMYLLALFTLTSLLASAQTITVQDSFNQPTVWFASVSAGFSITPTATSVNFRQSAGIAKGTASLTTVSTVIGDFTAEVNASNALLSSNAEAGLAVSLPGASNYLADVFFVGKGGQINGNIYTPAQSYRSATTTSTSVRFWISRSGQTVTEGFDDGTGIITVFSASAPSLSSPVQITLFEIMEYGNTNASQITFTNFTLETSTGPTISAVDNAGSFQTGPVSPGEIVTITGTNIGPAAPAYLTLDQNGNVSTSIGGVQALFTGIPAPLIFANSSQINAVVPYGIIGLINPSVQIKYQGQLSNNFALQSAAAVPALFTLNASGTGPAAILNQDGTTNSPLHPAPKGSYIVLYATGEGQTSPQGITGKITAIAATPPLTPQPLLPIAASIGGQAAPVAFYGEAPGLVSGVMQINVQVPTTVASGSLPVQISVGGTNSQTGVTVSVQ